MKISNFDTNLNTYVIAEVGGNHNGNPEIAMELVEAAAETGANAVKFQSYKANKIASKNSPSYWDLSEESTTNQYELFKKFED